MSSVLLLIVTIHGLFYHRCNPGIYLLASHFPITQWAAKDLRISTNIKRAGEISDEIYNRDIARLLPPVESGREIAAAESRTSLENRGPPIQAERRLSFGVSIRYESLDT